MKNIFFLFCLLCSLATTGQVTLYSESFETDGEGTRYTSNTFNFCAGAPGGNPDYFLRTNTNPALPPGTCTSGHGSALTNLQGSYFWASEDIRSSSPVFNANPPGDITTASININGYNTLTVSLYLATASNNNVRWENSDSINIQASINGGTFKTVGRFVGDNVAGGRLRIDTNLDGIGEGTAVDQDAFAQYTFSIPGTGNNLRIKLDFDQIGGTEELGIDLIEVKGVAVLPLDLLHFAVQKTVGGQVNITWKVSDGSSLAYFDLEKSRDGIQFDPVARTAAHASPDYLQTDENVRDAVTYYRLKSVEKTGKTVYSNLISLQQDGLSAVRVYPNPAPGRLMLNVEDDAFTGEISCRVFSLVGHYSQVQTFYKTGNSLSQEINMENAPKGTYLVQMQYNGQSVTKVFMLQ